MTIMANKNMHQKRNDYRTCLYKNNCAKNNNNNGKFTKSMRSKCTNISSRQLYSFNGIQQTSKTNTICHQGNAKMYFWWNIKKQMLFRIGKKMSKTIDWMTNLVEIKCVPKTVFDQVKWNTFFDGMKKLLNIYIYFSKNFDVHCLKTYHVLDSYI